jgi:putative Mg2+ transporter-C (MgtC) family protein
MSKCENGHEYDSTRTRCANVLRLLIAVALGALVGYKRSSPADDRERADKPAGVRTHSMVSPGAALFAVIFIHGFGGAGGPARVAAQVDWH